MSFWELSDGELANENTPDEYEVPGGNLEPIPNDSDLLARIKDVKWATRKDEPEKFVEIQWQVEEPHQFKNRIIFQKLWLAHFDPKAKTEEKAREKRDKARRLFATIDKNAKGILMKSSATPSDQDLALALIDARMIIKVMKWSMEDPTGGGTMRGNWVAGVKGKDGETRVGNDLPAAPSAPSTGGGLGDMDDEIPF